MPVVLSREETGAILKQLTGTGRLIAMVLNGSGVRLEECLTRRVKDLDFDRHQIIVRQGKGQKDRAPMLPAAAREGLTRHLADVRLLHERDLARGFGRVVLPFALDGTYPNAATEWRWQFVFPAGRICRAARFGPPSRYSGRLVHSWIRARARAYPSRSAIRREVFAIAFARNQAVRWAGLLLDSPSILADYGRERWQRQAGVRQG